MARYNPNNISYKKQDELLEIFSVVLNRMRSVLAIKIFLKDILNRQERLMLVRRFLIAELLLAGKSYREIQDRLKAGSTTISRVDRWLNFGRGGYKLAVLLKNKNRSHTSKHGSRRMGIAKAG